MECERIMSEGKDVWKKAVQAVKKAGILPIQPSDTFAEILKQYLTEDEAEFIGKAYKMKTSQTMEELIKTTKGMTEEAITEMCDNLAAKGFVFNMPSSSGFMVYLLMPIIVIGVFEYTFMRPKSDDPADQERLEKLAGLYKTLMSEYRDYVQSSYDGAVALFRNAPMTDRTVPIYNTEDGKEIKIDQAVGEDVGEQVMIAKNVEDIINKFDDISVGNCFCRSYQKILGHDCEINAPMEVCFTFGKSARYVAKQGFARAVSKEEALEILKKTDEAGLVHKAFHNKNELKEMENSICNCCPDCCDTFTFWKTGAAPIINYSSYLANVIQDGCTGCGICETKCPMGAQKVTDGKASVNEELCIGCGVCAHFCPENTISLIEKPRTVFLPPARLNQ